MSPISGTPPPQAPVVVARANGFRIRDSLVKFIASSFRPASLAGASLEQATLETPQQALWRLCGSDSSELYQAMRRLNGDRLPPRDTVMGTTAVDLLFPACLRVSKVSVSPSSLANSALSNLRSPFAALVSVPSNRPRGTALTAVVAAPVELTPNADVIPGVAVARIEQLSGGGGTKGAAAAVAPPMRGRIVERVGAVPADVPASAVAACPAEATAFDAALVRSVFEYSARRRPQTASGGVARLVVVDNGFFGVSDGSASTLAEVGPFPAWLFGAWARQPSLVGPTTPYGEVEIDPISFRNDWTSISVDEVAGHGTHVAGLTVGGPSFIATRDAFLRGPVPAFGLEIVNVGKAERDLLPNSQKLIGGLLAINAPNAAAFNVRIVNMSISYEGQQASGIFEGIFKLRPETLFVVAAGNTRDEVAAQSVYPAALGKEMNVLTVAAHDASEHPALAWFTNFGTAVDMAAPGCGVRSWLDSNTEASISGTSQAAPVASFAAGLLTALDGSFTASQLKLRLISSGRLLADPATRWKVRSGSYLDIPAALALYDDAVTVRWADTKVPGKFFEETWLGEVTQVWGLRCTTEVSPRTAYGRDFATLWGLKRDEDDVFLQYDRNVGSIERCTAATAPPKDSLRAPDIRFKRRARVIGSSVEPDRTDLSLGEEWTISLSAVSRAVFRTGDRMP
ncbi:S8 family serine peptidase [Sphingobium ummariense]